MIITLRAHKGGLETSFLVKMFMYLAITVSCITINKTAII